jgi:hypothetical protein
MISAPGYFHLHLISDSTGETLIMKARHDNAAVTPGGDSLHRAQLPAQAGAGGAAEAARQEGQTMTTDDGTSPPLRR